MEQPAGTSETLSFSISTDIPFIIGGVFLALLEFFFHLDRLLSNSFEMLQNLPGFVMPACVYVFCGLLILFGTQRVTTTFDEAKKRVIRTNHILFVIPFRTKKYSFARIRYLDIDHPTSGQMPVSDFHRIAMLYFFGIFYLIFGERGESKPYEIYMFMENRDRLLFCVKYGREKIVQVGEAVARITEKRIA